MHLNRHYHGYSVLQQRDRSLLTRRCVYCHAITLKPQVLAFLLGVAVMALLLVFGVVHP